MNFNSNKRYFNITVLISSILLIIVRHIDFFKFPRFWAEEGKVYFLDAYTNGISSLLHGHQGYYSIIPNFATYFSTLVPLEYAPIVTTFIAFLVQVLPFYLIFINKAIFFDSSLKKFIASLIVLFVAQTGPIWLNTISSQFHFIVILFIIMLDDKSKILKSTKNIYFILVFLSGMSGIPSNILTPFFFLKYLKSKLKTNLYLFIILVFTTLIQIGFILGSNGLQRVNTNFSLYSVRRLGERLFENSIIYPIFYSNSLYLTVLVLPLIYLLFNVIKKNNNYCIFFSTSFLLSTIMLVTSIRMIGGDRYFYASSVIFILGLHAIIFDKLRKKWIKGIALTYMVTAILIGIINYPIKEGTVDSRDWKRWKDEIILYKNQDIDTITIYPQRNHTKWLISLPLK